MLLIRVCQQANIHYVIENPRSSILWWVPAMHELLKRGAIDVDYHACTDGGDWDKAQRLRTDLPGLAAIALLCDGRHAHKP
eukprot:3280515-Heterocapsa_arctica.AAC.1